MTACTLCRVGSLPAALCELSGLKDLHIRGELPIDEDGDQVCLFQRSLRMCIESVLRTGISLPWRHLMHFKLNMKVKGCSKRPAVLDRSRVADAFLPRGQKQGGCRPFDLARHGQICQCRQLLDMAAPGSGALFAFQDIESSPKRIRRLVLLPAELSGGATAAE